MQGLLVWIAVSIGCGDVFPDPLPVQSRRKCNGDPMLCAEALALIPKHDTQNWEISLLAPYREHHGGRRSYWRAGIWASRAGACDMAAVNASVGRHEALAALGPAIATCTEQADGADAPPPLEVTVLSCEGDAKYCTFLLGAVSERDRRTWTIRGATPEERTPRLYQETTFLHLVILADGAPCRLDGLIGTFPNSDAIRRLIEAVRACEDGT